MCMHFQTQSTTELNQKFSKIMPRRHSLQCVNTWKNYLCKKLGVEVGQERGDIYSKVMYFGSLRYCLTFSAVSQKSWDEDLHATLAATGRYCKVQETRPTQTCTVGLSMPVLSPLTVYRLWDKRIYRLSVLTLHTHCIAMGKFPFSCTHSPILTVLWFHGLFCVTAHCAKFLCADFKISLFHNLYCHWAHVHTCAIVV